MSFQRNVFGDQIEACSHHPVTGFYRDGYCNTGKEDIGQHTVCAKLTEEFLRFSLLRGNDLITPVPEYGFAGLAAGDCWCLCARRWLEAYQAGVAPGVILRASNQKALEIIALDDLKKYAIDLL